MDTTCPGNILVLRRSQEQSIVAQLTSAFLRRARTQLEAENLFRQLTGVSNQEALRDLGISASCSLEDVSKAYEQCKSHWRNTLEDAVDNLVNTIMQTCASMMDADKLFRSLEPRIGRPVGNHGVLTADVLQAARARCHAYWSRVTPGNVGHIVSRMVETCPDWMSASPRFKWLWMKGDWSGDKRTITLAGRQFSAEDLAEAEKRCRERFGASPAPPPPSRVPSLITPVKQEDSSAQATSETNCPDVSVGEHPGSCARPVRRLLIKNAKPENDASRPRNVDFTVNHVLRNSDTLEKSSRYFDALPPEDTQEARQCCLSHFEEQGTETMSDDSNFTADSASSSSWYVTARHGKVSSTIKGSARRKKAALKRKKSKQDDSDFTAESASSSSSYVPARHGKARSTNKRSARRKQAAPKGKTFKHKKSKHTKKHQKRNGANSDFDGATFRASESDDLSGEEDLDEEDGASFSSDITAALADAGDIDLQASDDGYPRQAWEDMDPDVLPGHEGFNKRATCVLRSVSAGTTKLQVKFDENAACPPLQPHQEVVAFLLHPQSPIVRLLVDHPTGAGKTREMIRALDNYYFDPRPKVPIFPKDPVCRNFYSELLRWPSRYRDYFCCERPEDAAHACGRHDWREARFHMWELRNLPEDKVRRLCYSMRDVLEMKHMFHMGRLRRSCRSTFSRNHPGEAMPAAPLRALRYTSAGGSFSTILANGAPASALMKIQFDKGSQNVYSNKVVLMDEAHNLVRTQTQYSEQLHRLRDLLYTANNLVLAGFTGTPILNEAIEGRQLLDIIKGDEAAHGDEGYLSSFPMRPQPLFPVSLPRGIPDGVLTLARKKQLVCKVEIHGEALKMYDLKRRCNLPCRRLRAYCNVCTFFGTFHDGKHGTKKRILAHPIDCCPKLAAICQAIAECKEKAVVMISRVSGFSVMLELMRIVAAKAEPPFSVATMDQLSEFNHVSNLRGEIFRVLVADAAQCSEGVSFLAVRKTFLSDVPASPSMFIQQCGRAIRMYGHRGLPDDEQTVTNRLYVATLPRWMHLSSLACWAFRAQRAHGSGREIERRARMLTERLHQAGIKTLSELKAKVDARCWANQQPLPAQAARACGEAPGKLSLTTEDVVCFLEQHGLWDEARKLQTAQQKEKEHDQAEAIRKEPEAKPISRSSCRKLGINMLCSASIERHDDEFAKAFENVLDEAGMRSGAANIGQPGASTPSDGAHVATKSTLDAAQHLVTKDTHCSALAYEARQVCKSDDTEFGDTGAPCPGRARQASSSRNSGSTEPVAIALKVLNAACTEIDKIGYSNASQFQSYRTWKLQVSEGLQNIRQNEHITSALRMVAHEGFNVHSGNLQDLSIDQIKALRAELSRLDRIQKLGKAHLYLKEVLANSDQLKHPSTCAKPNDRTAALALIGPLNEHLDVLNEFSSCTLLLEAINAETPSLASTSECSPIDFIMDHVNKLYEEVARLKAREEIPAVRPRTLVRAMQSLYLARTANDAALCLGTTTADEDALQTLTQRSEELAPALAALREMAVDNEIFQHFQEKVEEEVPTESETGDVCRVLAEINQREKTLMLPHDRRSQLAMRRKRQARQFVDQSEKEVQATFNQLDRADQQTVDSQPPQLKRMRLHSAPHRPALGQTPGCASDDLHEITKGADQMEHAFSDACGFLERERVKGADEHEETFSCGHMHPDLEPMPGMRVTIHGLITMSELNGQVGRLVRHNTETGRWECQLAAGKTVNVKPSNVKVEPPDVVAQDYLSTTRGLHRSGSDQHNDKMVKPLEGESAGSGAVASCTVATSELEKEPTAALDLGKFAKPCNSSGSDSAVPRTLATLEGKQAEDPFSGKVAKPSAAERPGSDAAVPCIFTQIEAEPAAEQYLGEVVKPSGADTPGTGATFLSLSAQLEAQQTSDLCLDRAAPKEQAGRVTRVRLRRKTTA